MAYQPGEPSAGSTSPAWSFLLSVGYLLGIDHRAWAYGLGLLCLAVSSCFVYRLLLRLPWPDADSQRYSAASPKTVAALLAGLFCAVEWHLVWASVSGMETILFTTLSLVMLDYYFGQLVQRESWEGPASLQMEQVYVSAIGVGLLGGLLTLTRPEGLALAVVVITALTVFPLPGGWSQVRSRLLPAALSLFALALLVVPYGAFNLRVAGTLLPTSFYARQAQFQAVGSLASRYWSQLKPTLVGLQVLLLPGLMYGPYLLVRGRSWPLLLPLVWGLGLPLAYALLLPVSYQHGRYGMPVIPLLILYGVWGTAQMLRPRSPRLVVRIASRGLPTAAALVALVVWLRGAATYADDVGFVNGEMVAIAQWIGENTASDALIATQEIGAMGYLANRPLVDLTGRVTPELISFRADAEKLADWLLHQGVAFAVLFPGSPPPYAQLSTDLRFVRSYCSDYARAQATRYDDLCVYHLLPGDEF
jgi:hypothetical protein